MTVEKRSVNFSRNSFRTQKVTFWLEQKRCDYFGKCDYLGCDNYEWGKYLIMVDTKYPSFLTMKRRCKNYLLLKYYIIVKIFLIIVYFYLRFLCRRARRGNDVSFGI